MCRMKQKINIEQVDKYWSSHPCGSDLSTAENRKLYFDEIESKRGIPKYGIFPR